MLYIFDLDGTLIESFLKERKCEVCDGRGELPVVQFTNVTHGLCSKCSGRGYTLENLGYDRPLKWLPGRLELLSKLDDDGAALAIATNQTGVVHGYQTHEQIDAKMAEVQRQLHDVVNYLVTVYACRDTLCRKPSPMMLQKAMQDTAHKNYETIFVGDMKSDEQAAKAAGVAYVDAYKFFASTS
jgi:HAD superfamily hydrolase (TIGR01662 family)